MSSRFNFGEVRMLLDNLVLSVVTGPMHPGLSREALTRVFLFDLSIWERSKYKLVYAYANMLFVAAVYTELYPDRPSSMQAMRLYSRMNPVFVSKLGEKFLKMAERGTYLQEGCRCCSAVALEAV